MEGEQQRKRKRIQELPSDEEFSGTCELCHGGACLFMDCLSVKDICY